MFIVSSSQQSFLTNALTATLNPNKKILKFTHNISCSNNQHHGTSSTSKKQNELVKLAVVGLAAGVLTLGSVDDASAAKSGGRIGGQAFRPSAPRNSSPRINNSRTNIYINPRVAPPLLGGYGYGGYGVPFYGGWGPSAAIGFGGGFEILALFMFLGAANAVLRKFFGSRNQDDDEDY